MLNDHVLHQMCLARGKYIDKFDLHAALKSGEPVIMWHTSNGVDYIGYQLLTENSFESNVAFGVHHDKIDRYVACGKVHSISPSFFLEYKGGMVKATDIWSLAYVYYLGDALIERYRVSVQVELKRTPECKVQSSSI